MSTTFRATGYALCLSTLLLCATHAHASVSTSTGKINFNGKVTAPVPSIVVRSNGADTELSAGTTIDLGTVSADTLPTAAPFRRRPQELLDRIKARQRHRRL